MFITLGATNCIFGQVRVPPNLLSLKRCREPNQVEKHENSVIFYTLNAKACNYHKLESFLS